MARSFLNEFAAAEENVRLVLPGTEGRHIDSTYIGTNCQSLKCGSGFLGFWPRPSVAG